MRAVEWEALRGLAPALDGPISEALAGAPADAVLARLLRARPELGRPARAVAAEAVFGVALWRRRLRAQLGGDAPPRILLAALVRDLGGRDRAADLAGVPEAALPRPRPAPRGLADRFSLPDWLEREILLAEPGGAAALADALDLPGPVCFRANALRIPRDVLAARLAADGVATRPGALAPHCLVVTTPRPNVYGLGAHREGLFEVQDEGSQLLGAVVGARPGEIALDACAGAGGKTLLLAADVGPGGRVHAADPDLAKLSRLAARVLRAGASAIVAAGGAEPPRDLLADRVLVDAPCSELGSLRRGPDLRWRMDPGGFARLPSLQEGILARAARHVRPGGTLVYATCTFRREEDEDVALAFESAHAGFARLRPAAPAAAVTPDGFLRTWPHAHGTDAFFAAVWVRRA